MGSGTTAVAAMKNNRKFIGFETESKYIEIANQRIESTYSELVDNKLLHIDNKTI
jgi:site-specific DNA-methyltransferase (adenine-specific)